MRRIVGSLITLALVTLVACSNVLSFGVVIVNPCAVDVSVSIGLLEPDRIPTPPLRTVPAGGQIRFDDEWSAGFDVVLTAPDLGWDLQYAPEPSMTRTITLDEGLCPGP